MTSAALVLAPLTCSMVLLVSGIAKLGDPGSARDAFTSMKVPDALRSDFVLKALPYSEIALGVLLLATWSWPLAVVGLAVTALFATYWVLVLRVLRGGEEVDCGCFGALADDRITSATLARNCVLVALAALATAFGAAGSGVLPALRDFRATDWWWLLMSAAVAAAAVLVVGLRRPDDQVADEDLLDYERTPIPFAMLEDEAGTRTTLRGLATDRAQLLIFLSTTCYACVEVAKEMPAWAGRLEPVDLSAVYTEPLAHVDVSFRPQGVPAWYDVEQGATETFASGGRPSAVLLGADGQLAGGPVTGTPAVIAFVEEIEAELASRPLPERPAYDPPDVHDHGHGHGHAHDHEVVHSGD